MTERWPERGLERQRQCPVCGESRRDLLYSDLTDQYFKTAPGKWQLHLCVGCRSAYLDPRPTRETIGLAYRKYFTHEDRFFGQITLGSTRRALSNGYLNARYRARFDPALRLGRLVVPLFPMRRSRVDREVRHLVRRRDSPSVLDVGCGDGVFLERMQRAGWRGLGIDPDPRAIERCCARGVQAIEGTLETLNADVGPFDAITLSHVLEHVHDPCFDLSRARELLRSDGVLWLATPNLLAAGHADFGSLWLGLDPPRHLVVFTPQALAGALAAAGFRIVRRPAPAWSEFIYRISAHLAGRTGSPLRHRPLATHVAARLRPDTAEEIIVVAAPD